MIDSSKVRPEHCEDGRTKPIDAPYESSAFRASFQCKYINSYTNELLVNELQQWIDATFANASPGGAIRLQASTEAKAQTFQKFRAMVPSNHREHASGAYLPESRRPR